MVSTTNIRFKKAQACFVIYNRKAGQSEAAHGDTINEHERSGSRTNTMEHCPSEESNIFAHSEAVSRILWKRKVLALQSQESSPRTLSWTKRTHTTIQSYLFTTHFNIISLILLGLPCSLVLSGFPTKILCIYILSHACCLASPHNPPSFNRSSNTCGDINFMKLLIVYKIPQFSVTSVIWYSEYSILHVWPWT